jgi:fibronectin-binding autotransporter adhesin
LASRNMIWTGEAGDGDYTNRLNWDDATNNLNPAASPPTTSDFVSFSGSAGGTVNFDGGSAETLIVSGVPGPWSFSGTLTLSGQPSSTSIPFAFSLTTTVTFSAVTLTAPGYGGISGAVTVQGGSTVTTLGDNIGPQGHGSLTLTGTGTTWHVESNTADNVGGNDTGYLTIGDGSQTSGSGTLTVTAGAALTVDTGASLASGSATGSTGTATVSDGGTWTIDGGLIVGDTGAGTLDIEAGGTVTDNGFLTIGGNDGASGAVTVNGIGAVLDTLAGANLASYAGNTGLAIVSDGGIWTVGGGNLNVGYLGNGTLDIEAGGTVTNDGTYTFAGGSVGGTGTISVQGAGALLDGMAAIVIGSFGTGVVTVGDGGAIDTESLAVGQLDGSSGTLTIESGGAVTSTGKAVVGNVAGSTGMVADDGSLTLDEGLTIGQSGDGALTVGSGGTVKADGNIDVGLSAGSIGTLTINGGGTVKETEAPEDNNYAVLIGNQGVGTAVVTGAGALLDVNGSPLGVGYNAGSYGSLTISDGGTVETGTPNDNDVPAFSVGGHGTGLLTITGSGSSLTAGGGTYLGRGGSATVLVENSGELAIGADGNGQSGLQIGFGNPSSSETGGSGLLTVTTDGVVNGGSDVYVGGNGVDGKLNVDDGGIVNIGTQLYVGLAELASGVTYGGNGNVAIGAGGTVAITGPAQDSNYSVLIGTIGTGANPALSTGQITVSGTGALLNATGNEIGVGLYGTGSLVISQGGSVVSGTLNSSVGSALSVGRAGTGSVTVTGSGSSLTSDGYTYMGAAGIGSLLVQNSATMTVGLDTTGSGSLGVGGTFPNGTSSTLLRLGGSGSALVTSDGYIDSKQNVDVGSGGVTGTLTINNGGTVEANNQILIGNDSTLSAGGTVVTSTSTTIISATTVYAGAGTINVGAGGTLRADGTEPNGSASIVVGYGAGSTGALNVTGAGATVDSGGQRINIGRAGNGTMLVSEGGDAEAGANYTDAEAATWIGDDTRSTGALTVTDLGSTFTATGAIDVGIAGTGSLLVESGGVVTATSLDSAVDAGSTAIITVTGSAPVGSGGGSGGGPASQLDVAAQFTIGDTGSAELSILNGATATVGNMDIGLNTGSTGNVDLEGANTLLHDTGDLHVGDAGSAVLTIGAGTTLTVDGDLFTGTLGRIVGLGGVIDPKHYYNTTTTTGPLTIVASVAIVNTGTFIAENGLLELNGPVTDTGVLQIQNGGVLQVDKSIADTQTVEFSTTSGTLDIKDPTAFAPTIEGYATGDTVQVYGISGQPAPTYSNVNGNTILTYDNGVSLTFAGTFSEGAIDVQASTTPPPCFLIGTRIATERGEIKVQDLRIGDRVLTASGGSRPVRWIGSRTVDTSRHPKPQSVLPVRVAPHAFGPGAPHKVLFLSPDHAVFIEDALIPVQYLIDDAAIYQLSAFGEIVYYHVELDRHDVLLAEGLPVESYLDTGNRTMFENGTGLIGLHPDCAMRVWDAEGCAPLVVSGPALQAARRRVAVAEAVAA